jgi:hypothetical protein
MGKQKNSHQILEGKFHGKKPLGEQYNNIIWET